jgi:hypothetical protein
MDTYDGWFHGWGKARSGDRSAAEYFDSLPLEVKEKLNNEANKITSVEDLRRLGNQLENKTE